MKSCQEFGAINRAIALIAGHINEINCPPGIETPDQGDLAPTKRTSSVEPHCKPGPCHDP